MTARRITKVNVRVLGGKHKESVSKQIGLCQPVFFSKQFIDVPQTTSFLGCKKDNPPEQTGGLKREVCECGRNVCTEMSILFQHPNVSDERGVSLLTLILNLERMKKLLSISGPLIKLIVTNGQLICKPHWQGSVSGM